MVVPVDTTPITIQLRRNGQTVTAVANSSEARTLIAEGYAFIGVCPSYVRRELAQATKLDVESPIEITADGPRPFTPVFVPAKDG
jgi:hypothetical protein